jgi:hypothetical protein
MEHVTREDLKQTIRQYGLIKGNEGINEALIDRVATIVFREFEVQKLIPLQLAGGPIDLSNFGSNQTSDNFSKRETATEVVAAAPSFPRTEMVPVSSEIATVVASPVGSPSRAIRPPKTPEEQAQEVEAEMKKPLSRPEEPSGRRMRDGQIAPSTAQRSHFQKVIKGVTDRQSETLAERASAREDVSEELHQREQSPMLGENLDFVEVQEETGVDSIVDLHDTDLKGLFPPEVGPVSNPKDARALMNALPKRLDSDQDPSQRGKQRSIRRVD